MFSHFFIQRPIFAAVLSTIVSATIGVTSLQLGGLVARGSFVETWRSWWLGDAIGALLVAPMILVWATARRPLVRPERMPEAAADEDEAAHALAVAPPGFERHLHAHRVAEQHRTLTGAGRGGEHMAAASCGGGRAAVVAARNAAME